MNYVVLYRGPLRMCNFQCNYCPFVPEFLDRVDIEHIRQDKEKLDDFVDWIESQPMKNEDSISLFFAPTGEILIFKHYIHALVYLKNLGRINEIVVQSNGSFDLERIEPVLDPKLKLWITYHPEKLDLAVFIQKLEYLDEKGVSYCVGMVGIKEHLPIIEHIRRQLNPTVYLWVNAIKSIPNYYSKEEIERIFAVDPYFNYELDSINMYGKSCPTGNSVFLIDSGNVHRCILDKKTIGTIKECNLKDFGESSPCSYKAKCNCYISYSHNGYTNIAENFSNGKLARIPSGFKYNS